MKKIHFRLIAAVLALILLASMLIGCGRDTNDISDVDDEASPDFAFVPEYTSLSALAGDLPNMNNITIANNTVYFTSTSELKNDDLFRTTRIFTIDIDDSSLTYLLSYEATPPPPDAQGGGVHIAALHIDTDGNLWVAEESSFVEFDFPFHFDLSEAEVDEIWEHISRQETSYNVRKLDSTGAELQSIDVSHLSAAPDWYGIFSFHVDDDENIFIGSGQTIYVLDADGEALFSLDTGDDFIMPNSFIRLSDGRTAFYDWGGAAATALRVINVQRQSWGDNISLPNNVHNIFSGSDEYLAIINDSVNLLGIDIDTGEIFPIINWADSVGVPVGLGNVTFLPDGRVLFTTTNFDYGVDGSYTSSTELITLNRTPRDELPEKIVLTLAASWWILPEFTSAIAEFNRTNAFYRIETIALEPNWNTMADDFSRLALDITTGNGPDIIETTELPFNQWAARGIFVDLYELIDADPSFDRSDILDVVRRNAETNGKLYRALSTFTIQTMTGSADVVGSEPGWTFGELIAVLEANPQATSAFGVFADGMYIFQQIFMNHIDNFVNWETGTVDFDNDSFIEFLEFSIELRRVLNWWGDNRRDDGLFEVTFGSHILAEMVSSGEIIIETMPIGNFNSPYIIQRYFGEDFVFKGYPTVSGSGNSLSNYTSIAISAMSEHKEGAWEFLRMILSEQWQRESAKDFTFPTNRIVFEESLARSREGDEIISWAAAKAFPEHIQQDLNVFVDRTLALIDSAVGLPPGYDPILDIVYEGIDDIFAGRNTPQDAARIIQSRAAIYVAEQS